MPRSAKCPNCHKPKDLLLTVTRAFAAPGYPPAFDPQTMCPSCLLASLLKGIKEGYEDALRAERKN